MKKTAFIFATLLAIALAAGLVLTGCPQESKSDSDDSFKITIDQNTKGQLTINGLDEFDGKYAMAQGGNNDEKIYLLAYSNVSGTTDKNLKTTMGQIKNGEVILKVWKVDQTDTSATLSSYTGGHTVTMYVQIAGKANPSSESDLLASGMVFDTDDEEDITVTFTAGEGNGTFIQPPPEE